jgi:sugar diacid utilization regulator
VAEVLGGGVAVLDVDGHCLATVGDIALTGAVEEAAAAARGLGRTVQRGEIWATAVGPAGDTHCTLVLAPSGPVAEADLRIFERAAVVTALLLLSRRSVADAESRVRGELLDDLISRPLDNPALLRERARRVGVDLDRAHIVLVLRCSADLRHRLAAWAANQAAHGAGLAAYRDGLGVLLLPGDDAGALARRVARDARASLGAEAVTIGAAGPAHAEAAIAEAYRTAERCADALVSLGLTGRAASPADLGFVGLLMGGGEESVDGFVAATIGSVLDYDRRRGTALAQTLDAYFGAGASPARAAELLHVHVNTVSQRLERLATLLGEDWQRPERTLEIQLALRLHRLRAA